MDELNEYFFTIIYILPSPFSYQSVRQVEDLFFCSTAVAFVVNNEK